MYQGHESQYRKQRFTISHSISAYPDTMNGYCFLLLTLIYVPTVSGWVTQLAECGRYNGNFTERQDGKYFRSENITKVLHNVTRKECAVYCTTHLVILIVLCIIK